MSILSSYFSYVDFLLTNCNFPLWATMKAVAEISIASSKRQRRRNPRTKELEVTYEADARVTGQKTLAESSRDPFYQYSDCIKLCAISRASLANAADITPSSAKINGYCPRHRPTSRRNPYLPTLYSL